MIKIKKLEDDLCQVCFVRPHIIYPYSQIIQCIKCSKVCHKFCYDPSILGSQFQCDLCADGASRNQACYICGNRGLLKKIEENYAHPLCLLYSQNVFVVEYSSLKFTTVKSQKKSKSDRKFNCMNCQNPGSLEKCFADCQNRVHMYCAWKCFQKAQKNVWNHNTIVDDYDYQHFFQIKAVEYVWRFNETLGNLFGEGRKQPQKVRQFQLVCKDHLDSVFECCTQQKYFQKQNIEYIQCDQCLRWYHKECLDRKCIPKNQQNAFICPCCIDFSHLLSKIDQKDQLSLQRYPRFNVCDMIFLQYFFERKHYDLSQKQRKLMFSLPFEPSIKFLERILLNKIEKKIKVSNFQGLCDLKLEQRMSKKLFKEKFKNKLQIVMKLMIGKKSLHQLREQHNTHIEISKEIKNKSSSDVFEQEKTSLAEWISLFEDFKQTQANFAKISEKIIQKLRKWLQQIEEGFDIKQHESDQSQIQNSSDDFFEDKLKTAEKVKAKESESEQSNQIEEILRTKKQSDDQKRKSFFFDSNSRNQSSSELEYKRILDEQKQAIIIDEVKTIQKELWILKSDKEKLRHLQLELSSLEIGSLGLNKFQFKTLMDGKLNSTEIFWALIMERLLVEFEKILSSFKDTHSQSTFCTDDFGDSNRSQGHLLSFKLQIAQKRRMVFAKFYLDKLTGIHAAFPSKIRKQFKPRIQYLMNLARETVETNWQKTEGQIQEKLNFQEMLKHCSRDSSISYFKSLKTKIRETFDRGELELFRLEIERKKVMSKIRRIEFTLLKSNEISQELEILCQSSSSQIQLQSGQRLARTNKLREQIIGMQRDCLQKWLKMFSLVFNLSEQMAESTNGELGIEEMKKSDYKISAHCQEPLDRIQTWIQTDLKNPKPQTKGNIISQVIIFFEGLRQSRINFRVFHPKLCQTLPKLASLCFSYCAQNIKSWSNNEYQIQVVRYLYRNFKFYQSSDERYSRIIDILETDQKYSEYLNGVKDLLFKNPDVTRKVQQQIMTSMIRFYRQNSLVCRLSKLSQISAWITYYRLSLDIIGTQRLVPEQYQTRMQNDSKRSPRQRISFNILSVLVCQLHKHKFPSCYFTEKLLQIYEKAHNIEKVVSQFFFKQEKAIDLSYRLKNRFEGQCDIEKSLIQFQSETQATENKISTAEFHQLINTIETNEVSEIISFEIEKQEILKERKSFDNFVRKAEHILEKCDTNESIKSLNVLLLQIVSSPYSYININALQKYIEKRYASISSHQGRFRKYLERQYCALLNFLCSPNNANGQKLTRTQILLKIKQLEDLPEHKQISKGPYLQGLLLKIVTKIEEYDVIKDRLNLVYLKIDSNLKFSHQEILALEEPLQRYKAQNIEEFNFEILLDNFSIYKLAFDDFKDLNCSEREKVLDKLRGLKKQFLTPEFQKRRQQIQAFLSPY